MQLARSMLSQATAPAAQAPRPTSLVLTARAGLSGEENRNPTFTAPWPPDRHALKGAGFEGLTREVFFTSIREDAR